MRFHTCCACLLLALTLLLPTSCGGSDSGGDGTTPACRLNSDCASGERCEMGSCVEAGEGCSTDADCPSGQQCSEGGACEALECLTDAQCALGQVCEAGACLTDTDADRDRDGVPDNADVCPTVEDTDQADADADGTGDACDTDDDNDGVPDSADNCPRARNASQADADGDGEGNACDAEVSGATVLGEVDGSSLPGSNPTNARVFLGGSPTPVQPEADGTFRFEQALSEGGRYLVRVQWPGFLDALREFEATGDEPSVTLDPIVMQPQSSDPDQAASLVGQAFLADQLSAEAPSHFGILVQVLLEGNLVNSTQTDEQGRFALSVAPLSYQLRFVKEGYAPQTLEVTFDAEAERFEALGEPLVDYTGVALAPSQRASLRGQLTSTAEGVRFSDALVRLTGPQSRPVTVATDGTFFEDNLPAGLYTLDVDLEGHLRRVDNLDLGDGEADLGQLALTPVEVEAAGLTQLDGLEQHTDVAVRARRNDAVVDSAFTDDDGAFTLRLIPATYELSLRHPGFISQDHVLSWNPDEARFEVDGVPLHELTFTLLREPFSDRDGDGLIDLRDNCPDVPNPDQRDLDGDFDGDGCDADADGDGVVQGVDNCPLAFNPAQEDPDGDGLGVTCAAGTLEDPIDATCGVNRQVLSTLNRSDRLRSSFGGIGAGEVVYTLHLEPQSRVSVTVEADLTPILYVLDANRVEVHSSTTRVLRFAGTDSEDLDPNEPQLPAGDYRIVIDGFGDDDTGLVFATIQHSLCQTRLPELPPSIPQATGNTFTTADLDGDRNTDVVILDGGVLALVYGEGDGTFSERRTVLTDNDSFAIEVADLNSDGVQDIITGGRGRCTVTLGDLDRVYQQTQLYDPCRLDALQDMNGDGAPDLVSLIGGDEEVLVRLGEADGSFNAATRTAVGPEPTRLRLGDFDSDGIQDAAVYNSGDGAINTGSIDLLLGNGDGTFAAAMRVDEFYEALSGAADMNDDGALDLLVTGRLGAGRGYLPGRGDGTFDALVAIPEDDVARRIALTPHTPNAAADLNRDGVLDLISRRSTSDNGMDITLSLGEGRWEPPRVLTLYDTVRTIAVADINGDRAPDILNLQPNSETVALHLNLGQGSFTSPPPPPEGRAVDYIRSTIGFSRDRRAADMNGDGVGDTVKYYVLSDSGVLETEFGTELGEETTLKNPVEAADINNSLDLMDLADVDDDGDTDALLLNRDSDEVMTFLNDGTGRLTPGPTSAAMNTIEDLQAADLDGDLFPDLVAWRRDAGNGGPPDAIQALIGDGTGGFTDAGVADIDLNPPLEFVSPPVQVGDVNGDGLTDIVVRTDDDAGLALLRGQGDGAFQLTPLPTPPQPDIPAVERRP